MIKSRKKAGEGLYGSPNYKNLCKSLYINIMVRNLHAHSMLLFTNNSTEGLLSKY